MIAVLTAGGRVAPPFARAIETSVKALAPLGDRRRLIDPAIDAARACGARSVAVVGGAEIQAHCGTRIDTMLDAVDDGRANLESALKFAAGNEPLLLLTSDLPFITSAALEGFLHTVGDAEIAMPLACDTAYTRAYPNAADHATFLGNERIVNGSVFYFASGDAAHRALDIARRLFQARKSLLRMAALLDLPLFFRFLIGTLSIEHLEAHAHQKFGLHARAVRNSSPTLCYDIDTLEDYRYAVRLLERM